jgi:hypothetical protein
MVLIALYLWIRAYDLIFDLPPAAARPQKLSDPNHRPLVRVDPSPRDIAIVAK